jgi:hypothetical protein
MRCERKRIAQLGRINHVSHLAQVLLFVLASSHVLRQIPNSLLQICETLRYFHLVVQLDAFDIFRILWIVHLDDALVQVA